MRATARSPRSLLIVALVALLVALPLASPGVAQTAPASEGPGTSPGEDGGGERDVFLIGYLAVGLPDEGPSVMEATPVMAMRLKTTAHADGKGLTGSVRENLQATSTSSTTYNCRGTSPANVERDPFRCDAFTNPGKGTRIAIAISPTPFVGTVTGAIVNTKAPDKPLATMTCQFSMVACAGTGYYTLDPKDEPGYQIKSYSSGAGFYWIKVEVG